MSKVYKRLFWISLMFLTIMVSYKNIFAQDSLNNPGFYIGNQWQNGLKLTTTEQAWFNYGKTYFEARYNYEDTRTGSLYMGKEIDFDNNPEGSNCLIPMLGLVLGNTKGVSLGFDYTYEHYGIKFETENEYLTNWNDLMKSFYFDWTKLNYKFIPYFRLGLSTQFTIANVTTSFNLGPMACIEICKSGLSIEAFTYNLWDSKPTYLIGLEFMPK